MSYKYLIDSSAWVEYFAGSRRGSKIKGIIEEEDIATSILAIAELADKFEREKKSFDDHLKFIQSIAAIIPLTIDISLSAAKLKKKYRSKNSKFGLIDAIHLATSQQEKSVFVTTETDFAQADKIMLIQG